MTLKQFMVELAACGIKWEFLHDYKVIRGTVKRQPDDYDYLCCPVIVVCGKKTGKYFHNVDVNEAGKQLGLKHYGAIVVAADALQLHVQTRRYEIVRKALEKACGLAQQ